MGRDGIKIVEFDRDDDPSPDARPNEKMGIKIIEFDNDRDASREGGREGGRKTVATARDIGPIKIVEFDDDRPSGGAVRRFRTVVGARDAAARRQGDKDQGFRRGSRGRPAKRDRQ